MKSNSSKEKLKSLFVKVRRRTEFICEPLAVEDYSVQPITEVSPPKWHLAHTTWFFEEFILAPYLKGYRKYSKLFSYLFNSYYNNLGNRILRNERGLMTRPTVKEVYRYRKYVTEEVNELLKENASDEIYKLLEIGINHEQQHQELLAYDIKYILGHQVNFPEYQDYFITKKEKSTNTFLHIEEGVYDIGYNGKGFHFDNELGFHKVYLREFQISNRLTTNGEFLDFIKDGGYQNFNLWHAEGWDWVCKNKVLAPLYWHRTEDGWSEYNYRGLQSINADMPVMHISYYEAFAFAEWKGLRLPTEFEWEIASKRFDWGQLWEWTSSAYLPYPGFVKAPGALGEYNGKFMVNQNVLRGSSVATPEGHSRSTYRNFFHASQRQLFSGLRLAK